MEMNYLILLAAALLPMIIGFIWYNPKVFGNVWMKAADMTEEKMKGANMVLVFGLSYLFSIILASALMGIVIHQWGVFSLVGGNPEVLNSGTAADFMAEYGTNFRTFKHGLLHGVIAGFTLALPILATNAMFERKGFKYIAVNAGYWIVTMGLMGGVICQFM
tara:strand:- start:465 stop:950 length:486 start_codon:yes stop_codon:yes gene_type:complete